VGDERRADDAKVNVNDEDINVCRELLCCNGLSRRPKDCPHKDDPNDGDNAYNNECRKGPFKKGVFRDSPELEMPGIGQGP